MSRISAPADTVTVKPSANVYTVLAAAGFLAAAMCLLVLVMRGQQLGIGFF